MKIKLFAGIGCVSMIAAIFLAIKNAKEEEVLSEEEAEKETKVKMVIRKVKSYWPTILAGSIAIFCFMFALKVSAGKTLAAVTAYKVTSDAYERYREATADSIGKNKEAFVYNDAAGKAMQETKIPFDGKLFKAEKGDTLFYDIPMKKYFRASIQSFRDAEFQINAMLADHDRPWFYSYKSFFTRVGLKNLLHDLDFDPNLLGWNSIDGPIQIGYAPQVIGDGERCIVLTYKVAPSYEYDIM